METIIFFAPDYFYWILRSLCSLRMTIERKGLPQDDDEEKPRVILNAVKNPGTAVNPLMRWCFVFFNWILRSLCSLRMTTERKGLPQDDDEEKPQVILNAVKNPGQRLTPPHNLFL